MTKVCRKCKEEKNPSAFQKSGSSKDGLSWWCSACSTAYQADRKRRLHPEKYVEKPTDRKNCKNCGIEKPLQEFKRSKSGRLGVSANCKPCDSLLRKPYYEENRDEIIAKASKWNKENPERSSANFKRSHDNNPERTTKARRGWVERNPTYKSDRQKVDIQFKLGNNLRRGLRDAVVRGQDGSRGGSAVRDLGCSVPFFKDYLESLFKPGMTWDNYGFGRGKWTLDHLAAVSRFDLTQRQHVLLCCHYLNIQPMWFLDNIRKSNKWPEILTDFQSNTGTQKGFRRRNYTPISRRSAKT